MLLFETAGEPHNGYCAPSVSEGVSLETEFTFKCFDWQDTSLPLTYEFVLGEEPISYGTSPSSVSTVLPAGSPNEDFHQQVTIVIKNAVGVSVVEKLLIKVLQLIKGKFLNKITIYAIHKNVFFHPVQSHRRSDPVMAKSSTQTPKRYSSYENITIYLTYPLQVRPSSGLDPCTSTPDEVAIKLKGFVVGEGNKLDEYLNKGELSQAVQLGISVFKSANEKTECGQELDPNDIALVS